MNKGFYGFPNAYSGSTIVDIKEFDSSGTYVIPDGARRLWIAIWGAGSGGGGGARQGSGVAAFGGGGGGGGMVNMAYYFVESIGLAGESYAAGSPNDRPGSRGKTLTIVIGAGGSGGNGGTTDTSNGSNGGRGGDSWVSVTGMTFSANGMISAYGGANYGSPFGSGGTTTSGSGGAPASVSNGALINGVPSAQTSTTYSWNGTSSSATLGVTVLTVYGIGNNGGTAGGGISTANTALDGGSISYGTVTTISVVSNPLLSTSGNIKNGGTANGTAPAYTPIGFHAAYSHGFGGVGGGAGTSTSGANGEDGWRGSGGGGGGASRNGFTAGNGGRGGNGYCLIVALR
jgi:hypothetical protein